MRPTGAGLGGAGALGNSLAELLGNTGSGVIQLDRGGRIVAANDRARDLLRGGDGLFDEGGFLRASSAEDDAGLQRLLTRVLPPLGGQGASGSATVRRPTGLARLVLHASPVADGLTDVRRRRVAALVLVADPSRLARPIVDWGGLTLLDMNQPDRGRASWSDWFAASRGSAPECGSEVFDSHVEVLEAAAGRGIAMGWRHCIERYLETGAIVMLEDGFVEFGGSFVAVLTAKGRRNSHARQCLSFFGQRSRKLTAAGRPCVARPIPAGALGG